jgi:heme/copper-type cytochrome/quinol oxidase subunit 3
MTATAPTAQVPNRAGLSTHAAVVALGASVLMGVGGLGAAYMALRFGDDKFVDPKMYFNNYAATMALVSLALASFAANWGAVSARIGNRRWASTGFGLAALIGLATLNLVWFIGKGVALPIGNGPYAVVMYALLTVGGIAVFAGFLSSIAGLVSSFGGHTGPSSPSLAKAAAWGQHIAGLTWLIVFALVFLKK